MRFRAALILSLFSLLVLVSCGTLKITPRSCSTESIWGTQRVKTLTLDEKPIYFSSEDSEDSEEENAPESQKEKMEELRNKENYFVIADTTVRLKDLLEEHDVRCEEVKKMNLKMETKFFFWRELTLKIDR